MVLEGGNHTQNLPITSPTLLPQSYITNGRIAEASLLITDRLETSANTAFLSDANCVTALGSIGYSYTTFPV